MISTFSQLTTLRLGGSFDSFVTIDRLPQSKEHLKDFFSQHDYVNYCRGDILLIGGGSNLIVSDKHIPRTVIKLSDNCDDMEIHFDENSDNRPYISVSAGCVMDQIIEMTISYGYGGIEALSGIPGTVGGALVQNIGAYGLELSQVVHSAYILDCKNLQARWYLPQELAFSYRHSKLKFTQRYIVLRVKLWLHKDCLSTSITYPDMVKLAQIRIGSRLEAAQVRQMVLQLRSTRGMVLASDDYDTWSVGSFFTNPLVDQKKLSRIHHILAEQGDDYSKDFPTYQQEDGYIKLSAAWLIERSGFYKGYPGDNDEVRISTKHSLALTNRGRGTTEKLLALAREIRSGVYGKFGVVLDPEAVFVDCSL